MGRECSMTSGPAAEPSVPVLTWGERDGTPTDLVAAVAARGWLPVGPSVVLQVGRSATEQVLDTVEAVGCALRAAGATVRVGGPGGRRDPAMAAGGPAALAVSAIGVAELAVPRWWFEDVTLVTVAAPCVCPRLGLAAVLEAQAAVLELLGNRAPGAVLAYEAHRLARSDLAIACGRGANGERWWVAGPSDVAVEQVVAAAAGMRAVDLPALAAIARHEVLPRPDTGGRELPPLGVRVPPRWLLWGRGARERGAAAARELARDAGTVWRNLGKVPAFVRRTLASRARRTA